MAVTATFGLAGLVWVIVTDLMLYGMTDDPVVIARIETAKGWTFIGLSAALVYLLTFRGVSGLARQRRLLVTLVESIGDGVLLLGRDRTIVHANPAALAHLRCEKPEELAGMSAEEFSRSFRVTYPDGRLVPPNELASLRVFDEGGPIRFKCILHAGSEERIFLATGAAVRERADDPPSLVVSIMHDITEADRLDQLRDQFFAAAAHALKTPITIIGAHARIFSTEPSPRAQRSAAAVTRQCALADALIQNLLVLSRAHSGTLILHPHPVLLSSIVARVADDQAVRALGSEVERRIIDEDDLSIWVDDERMVTALRNLVFEAAQDLPGTPITLLVRRSGEDAEIGVGSQLPESEEPQVGIHEDERTVGREVIQIVVTAHGGSECRERSGSNQYRWIRLPILRQE
jgi:signal transduction histidine kinase